MSHCMNNSCSLVYTTPTKVTATHPNAPDTGHRRKRPSQEKGALALLQRPQATCGRRGRLVIGAPSLARWAGPPVCPSPHAGRGKGGARAGEPGCGAESGRRDPISTLRRTQLGRGLSCAGRKATVAGARAARSSFPAASGRAAQSAFSIPGGGGGGGGGGGSGPYGSQDSVHSSPEDGGGGGGGGGARDRDRPAGGGPGGPRLVIGSLPAHLSPHLFGGFKCPVCSKFVPSDEMDLHLVMCLTKPRITYNEDVLSKDAGECAICLEELQQGDTIARLPCLCVYHKGCIDEWFEVSLNGRRVVIALKGCVAAGWRLETLRPQQT
ncbi:zinc and ring finger 2 [Cricetulus griseus]